MKAIVVETTGSPDVLQLRDRPPLNAKPGHVVVDVAAAGVNFIDLYFRSGSYSSPLPFTPGKEGAGTVRTFGEGVGNVDIGQRVAWAMGGSGSYAEETLIPADLIVPVPHGVSFPTAAAVMLQGMTAHYLSESIVALKAGDTVLVHAGAGGVGLLLTQMLARRDIRVITTTSTDEKVELSLKAGASDVINYTLAGVARRINDLTRGSGVDVVFDGVGASTFAAGLDSLRPRGTMVLYGAASGPVPPIDPQLLNSKGSLMLTRPSLTHFIADRAELSWRAKAVLDLVAAGDLDVRIGGTYALADAAQAHRDLAGRRSTGKLLIAPR